MNYIQIELQTNKQLTYVEKIADCLLPPQRRVAALSVEYHEDIEQRLNAHNLARVRVELVVGRRE